MSISDVQNLEFRKVSSIRHHDRPELNRLDHGPRKRFILIGYLSRDTAERFVVAWKEYGEKDVKAIIFGCDLCLESAQD